jgi:hypothetical protein
VTDEESELETKFLGLVEVDSGTLLVADPAYVLPNTERGKLGVDYSAIFEAKRPAGPIDGQPVLLLQDFGGDGSFPVFGHFDGSELMSITIYFSELGEE